MFNLLPAFTPNGLITFPHRFVRELQVLLAANTALIMSTPTIAAMTGFLVYAASGHSLNAANIFTSLSLFNLLRTPLTVLRKFL